MVLFDKQSLTAQERDLVKQTVARLADSGISAEMCHSAIDQAYGCSSLDFRTIFARFLWLADPEKRNGINLLAHAESMTAEQLARTIVAPKDTLLELVQAKSLLPRALLEQIYQHIREGSPTGEPHSIDDLTEERILQEIKWWLVDLRFPEYYFKTTSPREIANQIVTNRFYELQGTMSEAYSRMKISYASPFGTRMYWVHGSRSLEVEEEVEQAYYSTRDLYNIAVYIPYSGLLLYIVDRHGDTKSARDFGHVSPASFLSLSDAAARARYKRVWESVAARGDIQIDRSFKAETGEHRAMIGFPVGTINHFLANISRVFLRYGLAITRKYTVLFGGETPVVVSSLYTQTALPDDLLENLVNVSLYPNNRLSRHIERDTITPTQANFINAAILFAHQFMGSVEPNIALLQDRFRHDAELGNILKTIQTRVNRDTYTYEVILEAFYQRPDMIHELFEIFVARFHPSKCKTDKVCLALIEGLRSRIQSSVLNSTETAVFSWAIQFVEAILRTNFFVPTRMALAFRLDPEFFEKIGFSPTPYGVFFIVGRVFHGFHVRFKDIARGGIRLIHSTNYDEYVWNSDNLFEECYNLAYTQNKKNKDIPEGGSKGVILLNLGSAQGEGEHAFKKYVNALLDLMLPANHDFIANYEQELLFLGPDEGTAEFSDWAAKRAREVGYRYWKAFTTGKQAVLGGISHKQYGMTTQGIRRYVLGILRKLKIHEADVTKVQTGGPDGDLGSNEIIFSRDKTIAVIDGGGVLYDPAGIDREELTGLVRRGANSSSFESSRLSLQGFKVSVEDRNITLPDGTLIVSGITFRNNFHLERMAGADLFLPCGGRPKSIDVTNWHLLLDEGGQPIYRWIVEGANLFITQDARLKLEEKGVILLKDSSTNKGGVISSAYEVLAALSLSEREFEQLMVVSDNGEEPRFRRVYITQVIEMIQRRADLEFDLLWRTHEQSGAFFSEISEQISEKINEITAAIEDSPLFENQELKTRVLALHIPIVLVDTVGMPALMERIPPSYQRAIFARTLAGTFIYQCGIDPGFEEYRNYVDTLSGDSQQ